ncbi:hypothetical protein L249_6160 [Ophiocordyceps polyrhachis-furcata BCC 54312]|uniref:Uncharacterized protein n=1 Tax=Ophiocordyceps polyrhachis-furcata BCC 54312 TaxID=1330021 RepID=A0A367LJ19_9HYPO|nr:hypothetical protein L249_6160 [Ophiocordyceps polyrhachis-furcata BCC 54312]
MSNYIAGGGCCPSCCQAPDLGDHDYCPPCTCTKPTTSSQRNRRFSLSTAEAAAFIPDRHLTDEQFHRNEHRRQLHYQTHLFQQQQAREAAAERERKMAEQKELEKQLAKDKKAQDKEDRKKQKKQKQNQNDDEKKKKDRDNASCTAI